MRLSQSQWKFIGLVALSTLLHDGAAESQETAAAKTIQAPRSLLGAGDCAKCHLNGLPKDDAVAAVFPGLVNDSWVLLEETRIWATSDKHVQAFTTLLNERSKRMGELLGVAEIHRDKRCLACHTAMPLAQMGGDARLMPAELANELKIAHGVGCEGCHGPAGDVGTGDNVTRGWLAPHTQKDRWRFLPGAEKRDKFGFNNVRSVTARTRLCLACHLGNAAEGKVVTHEMYAAGHPPLPGFELATFTQQMPKHWRDFEKKSEAVRTEFLQKNSAADDVYGRESFQLGNLHETRNALVAALVSLSENLKLSAALADEKLVAPVEKPDWPELAQFECFACHHDLKDKGWRQRRTVRGAPGRPMMRTWPMTLAKVALKVGKQNPDDLDQRMQAIDKMLSEQPFGRRDRWQQVVPTVTEWIDQQAQYLERQALPRANAIIVMREIVNVAGSDYWDYDSARQLVWAARTLAKEFASDPSDEKSKSLAASWESGLAEIEKLFVMTLTDGRKATQQLPGSARPRDILEVDLTKTLPPIADYDAIAFRERFRKLADKVK